MMSEKVKTPSADMYNCWLSLEIEKNPP
jgi:hypothetical protein